MITFLVTVTVTIDQMYCMYVYMFVRIYVCMCVYMHVCVIIFHLILIFLIFPWQFVISVPLSDQLLLTINPFSEWKSHVMSSVDEKVHTLKKMICISVKPIFSKHEVQNFMFSCKEDFVIVPIDQAANNEIVPLTYKHFYALTIIKSLNLDCHLSNRDDNNTSTFINNKNKDQIVEEHKLYLYKHKIN